MNDITLDPTLYDLFEFKPRKGDLKKIQIIEAAIECLALDGIEKTTFESIGKKIGTRRAHVAYHFSDKNKIFISAVKYILANYQQTIIDHMNEGSNGKKMILEYIAGAFDWAIENRTHLTVIFLLYYNSQLYKEYKDLNNVVRSGGISRLSYILKEKFNNKFTKSQSLFFAKQIQDLMSGAMLDATTTHGRDLEQAKKDVVKTTLILIDN